MATVPVDKQRDQDDRRIFGAFLADLRFQAGPKKIKQTRVLAHLPGWTHSSYSRLEDGITSPRYEELAALYAAFLQAGVAFSPSARQQFVAFARKRIELQQTYKDIRTDAEWAQLVLDLMRLDGQAKFEQHERFSPPFLADVGHLVDRPLWHEELRSLLSPARGKKLVIVRGTAGVGKSSELSRLATHLLGQPSCRMIFCNLHSHERTHTPEEALGELLGSVFTELGVSLPQIPTLSFADQTTLLLDQFERLKQRQVLLIDHGECLMQENQRLAPCWERFFSTFLRGRHQAKIVLATRLWLGWTGSDPLFVDETTIPPLSEKQTVSLLQRLGLQEVPVSLLQEVYHTIGGIPVCLEWVATLVKRPQQDAWDTFEMGDAETTHVSASPAMMTESLRRLLTGPRVFGGPPESVVQPFLERLLSHQLLSDDASHILRVLSITPIPLAKPALEVICQSGPGPYEELHRASLVVASRARTQLLPMVATSVMRSLSIERVQEGERLLIEAYSAWLAEGMVYEREAGGIINELAVLLLKHHRLLDAVQLLIRYGWLPFNLGYTMRLAQQAADVLDQWKWHSTPEDECGGLLLRYYLLPYLGQTFDLKLQATDYEQILALINDENVLVHPSTDIHVTRYLMVDRMNHALFQEAEALLDACRLRVAAHIEADQDLKASLLERRAALYGTWCEAAMRHSKKDEARQLREQAISLYQQASNWLVSEGTDEAVVPLQKSTMMRRLARCLNDLGFHLNRTGAYEQALSALNHCIALKKQGYVEPGSLAASYDEKAQSLAGLGRFQEALAWIDMAEGEVNRLAKSGHTPSQEETWIYRVSRAHLLLQCGKSHEAGALLEEASSHIHPRRKTMYDMFIDESLDELKHGRQSSSTNQYQLDWRWIERYREIAAFNSLWWLAPSGPFTDDEAHEWHMLVKPGAVDDEACQSRLEALVTQAREREVSAAFAETREPRFYYPVIPIDDVEARLVALAGLEGEINRDEPNALVRHFYHDAIAEQRAFLRMIQATAKGDGHVFRACNQQLHPQPTSEEMQYALSRAAAVIQHGLGSESSEVRELAHRVQSLLQERILTSDACLPNEAAVVIPTATTAQPAPLPGRSLHLFAPQVVQRFFEAVLHDANYDGWSVSLDATAQSARIEQGLRQLILPTPASFTLEQVRTYLAHELGGHVARAVAGERSPLGLLGIGTKNSLTTEEGLALYLERQAAALQGTFYDESRLWLGTLATGMASGVLTHPQSFRSLFVFFEAWLLLYRLLLQADKDSDAAQARARYLALARCLRTFRGVPYGSSVGICSTKDAVYLRGYWLVKQAVDNDPTMIDRLAVGVVTVEDKPALGELDLTASTNPPAKVALDPDLEARLLSFEERVSSSMMPK